ncbi:hypothetical protein TNCV_4843431 [Trichonephila clavipes]|uniref:Uncharacterized protein n=1 Tax=Trichonephila clavipes TaxID=2585209 RepID=A0A8X7BL50_TRICX|nr:hypothetical protein TNCV_4843431 [Trichonephila clavipes]
MDQFENEIYEKLSNNRSYCENVELRFKEREGNNSDTVPIKIESCNLIFYKTDRDSNSKSEEHDTIEGESKIDISVLLKMPRGASSRLKRNSNKIKFVNVSFNHYINFVRNSPQRESIKKVNFEGKCVQKKFVP